MTLAQRRVYAFAQLCEIAHREGVLEAFTRTRCYAVRPISGLPEITIGIVDWSGCAYDDDSVKVWQESFYALRFSNGVYVYGLGLR